MPTKRTKKATKRVKSLAARKVSRKQANEVKGGGVSHSALNVSKLVDKASPKFYQN